MMSSVIYWKCSVVLQRCALNTSSPEPKIQLHT